MGWWMQHATGEIRTSTGDEGKADAGVASTGNRLSLEGDRHCLQRRGEASWWKEYLGQGHLPAEATQSPT